MSNTYGIFEEWKNGLLGYADKAGDKLLGNKQSVLPGQDTMRRGDGLIDQGLNYAGGKIDQGIEATKDYVSGEDRLVSSPSIGQIERDGFRSQKTQAGKDLDKIVTKGIDLFDKGTKKAANKIEEKFITIFPELANKNVSDVEKQKLIEGANNGKVDSNLVNSVKERNSPVNEKDIGTLEKLTGVNFDTAKANWKDKGGFEGLMSNPAFSLGLALMQSSANGKTINQGILDNFVKSAKISSEFKDRIKAKAGGVTEATGPQMDKIKGILENSFDISGPILRRLAPGNQSEKYEQAVEDIVFKVQAKVTSMKKAAEKSGKSIEVGSRLYKKIIQDMVDSGQISKKGGLKLFGVQVFDSTVEAKPMAKGGPITQGKPYLVGEKGPEIIIPRSDGDVLTNDDSQIYAMLLASNPQLQKVSKARAEKIMRNRFPEYFEG